MVETIHFNRPSFYSTLQFTKHVLILKSCPQHHIYFHFRKSEIVIHHLLLSPVLFNNSKVQEH